MTAIRADSGAKTPEWPTAWAVGVASEVVRRGGAGVRPPGDKRAKERAEGQVLGSKLKGHVVEVVLGSLLGSVAPPLAMERKDDAVDDVGCVGTGLARRGCGVGPGRRCGTAQTTRG